MAGLKDAAGQIRQRGRVARNFSILLICHLIDSKIGPAPWSSGVSGIRESSWAHAEVWLPARNTALPEDTGTSLRNGRYLEGELGKRPSSLCDAVHICSSVARSSWGRGIPVPNTCGLFEVNFVTDTMTAFCGGCAGRAWRCTGHSGSGLGTPAGRVPWGRWTIPLGRRLARRSVRKDNFEKLRASAGSARDPAETTGFTENGYLPLHGNGPPGGLVAASRPANIESAKTI